MRNIILLSFLMCTLAFAQRPHAGYVFPAGVRQGETATLLVGGQFLEGTTNVILTGTPITAQITSFSKDLDRKELNALNNRRQYLEAKIPKASEQEKPALEKQLARVMQILAYREKMPQEHDMMMYMKDIEKKKQPNAQLTELVRLELTVPADAPLGRHELRLVTPRGVTEPIAFEVGRIAEIKEREPNDDNADAVPVPSFPAELNGQILPGEVDRYKFSARKGQRLVFSVEARSLIPYLADAVPGWFQAVLTVFNAKGKELAYADDFLGNPDPVLPFTVPDDGDYYLEIRDSIYRGRDDFVYRISAGELPFVAAVFPLGGQHEKETKVSLSGYNLAAREFSVVPKAGSDILPVRVPDAENTFLFLADDLPSVFDAGSNNTTASAQRIVFPSAVNGRIESAGDVDVFSFSGKAGSRIVAEVYARRLGSPLDSALRLTDAKGATIMTNDDFYDRSSGLTTHHADSYFAATLPANGTYYLSLRDTQSKGGEYYSYRLRFREPKPDFKLRVAPSSVHISRGGTAMLTAYVQRIDNFTGDIVLSLDDPPEGIAFQNATLSGTNESVKLTVRTSSKMNAGRFALSIAGTSGGPQKVLALPAEDMMQAFAYRHLVPAEELIITVDERSKSADLNPKSVENLKAAIKLVGEFAAQAAGMQPGSDDAFVAAYAAERLAGFERIRTAAAGAEKEKVKTVIAQNVAAITNILSMHLLPNQADKARVVLGPLFGELDREVLSLLDAGVPQGKVIETIPILSDYARSLNEEVYAKAFTGKTARSDMAAKVNTLREYAAKRMAPIIGDGAASSWAEQVPLALVGGGEKPKKK
ncbi:MAG: PPC domain-containing protein [Spirochaetota bacterium]